MVATSCGRNNSARESRGMVERASIQKLPFKYLTDMVFWSVTTSPFSPIMEVRKTTMMSMRKRKSIMVLIVVLCGDLVISG